MKNFILSLTLSLAVATATAETSLSKILTPNDKTEPKLHRQSRSYYDQRYPRPLFDRLEERPRCGRCDPYDEDYDRPKDRFDERRPNHRPTYGNRFDRTRVDEDRDGNAYDRDKNGTEGQDGKKDRDRPRDRNRYDDRDRYRPDYYDRFLGDRRDPYRERSPYDDDRERRPLYDRYPERYDEMYERGYDVYGSGARRPAYDDRYDRGNGYDDAGYGGYGPGLGRGPHDSFRPWDETYRGQAGFDDGGRGYYFASGRPDAAQWGRPEYPRGGQSSGWQNVNYPQDAYRDRDEYRGPGQQDPYRGPGQQDPYRGPGQQDPYRGPGQQDPYRGPGQQDYQGSRGYPPSGWHSVNERRPYRDQSGVSPSDTRGSQTPRPAQSGAYGQTGSRGQATPQPSSTTPGNSYLYQREDEGVTHRADDTTQKTPS